MSIREEDRYYYLAIIVGLAFHATVLFSTFTKTYDAYVHMFFAEHYANDWFGSWSFKWYTGFTVTSYPPLIHQLVALVSKFLGIKLAFLLVANLVVLVYLRGVYTFSKIWVTDQAAAVATMVAVFYPSFVEALHLFGQLPSITGVSLLLNACPFVYRWVRFNQWKYLLGSLSLLAATTSAHHVSTIFGMVFFVLPVMGTALIDRTADQSVDREVRMRAFLVAIVKILPRAIAFGLLVIAIVITFVFPYWYWSKADPIAQVSIPHGSRDNYLEVLSSGLVFFLIPWAYLLFVLPYIFRRAFQKRFVFLGLSLTLAFVLGTGGTTPIARTLLGDTAFEILTLDRFTFWATMLSLPFVGELMHRVLSGDGRALISKYCGLTFHRILMACTMLGAVLTAVLIINTGYFRPLQPQEIDIKPIVNFLSKDMHDHWRYLTLGFGDQMAWLSANTSALTVDGNYHSVRRLPELTTRAVERLENAKYLGEDGLAALQQFLTLPEKYHLKYIFSNDKFYEPLLNFSGWLRTGQLENGIVVWERPDVPPLPEILPSKQIPPYQSLMWGILPLSSLLLVLIVQTANRGFPEISRSLNQGIPYENDRFEKLKLGLHALYILFATVIAIAFFKHIYATNHKRFSPDNLVESYFDALDFKYFRAAYNLFDPTLRPSFEQYMLELSLEDGILASYAKLNSVQCQQLPSEDGTIVPLRIQAEWMTSLMTYDTNHYMEAIELEDGWHLLPQPAEIRIPPEQFYGIPAVDFKKQGRRKATVGKTDRTDELDRPDVYITQANLVSTGDGYAVVGELVNIDTHPAYVSVTAVLYDDKNREILRYNARDIMKHHLLSRESTPFRVDFDEIARQSKINMGADSSFLSKAPHDFVVFVNSMVSSDSHYVEYGLQEIAVDSSFRAVVYNYGAHEINVPQVLAAQYLHGKLQWVEGQYLPMGIRPQRWKQTNVTRRDLTELRILREGSDRNLFVNNSSRSIYSQNLPDLLQGQLFEIGDGEQVQLLLNPFVNFSN